MTDEEMWKADLATWEWGEPPPVARQEHIQSCIIGATTIIKELKDDGWFSASVRGGQLEITFAAFDNLEITKPIDLVEEVVNWESWEDAQYMVYELRRMADEIEKKYQLYLDNHQ